MSGMFGRDDKTTGPWKPQQPYIERGLGEAEGQFLDRPNQYTDQYQQALGDRGQGGAGYERAGQQQLQDTLSGKYLYGGDGFNAAYQAASNKIIPQVASSFEKYGRHGSPAEMSTATGALGDAFAGLYGQERQRQMGALSQIPGMQGVDYGNIGALGQAGDVQRKLLERYMAMAGQRYGGTDEGGGQNKFGSVVGGALKGAASGYGMGVPGMLVGGGAGAIGGMIN